MIEGSFVTWEDAGVDGFGIVNEIDGNCVNIFILEIAEDSVVYYDEDGKDNVKVESEVFPKEIKDFGGDDGVYSKTYSDGMYDTTLDDKTLKVLGDKPVERHILHLLRDHFPGKEDLQKKYGIDFENDGLIADIIRDAKVNSDTYDGTGGVAIVFSNGLVGFSGTEAGEYGSEAVIECAVRLKDAMHNYATVCNRYDADMLQEVAVIMAVGPNDDRKCINPIVINNNTLSEGAIDAILKKAYDKDVLTPQLVKDYVALDAKAPSDCYSDVWNERGYPNY